MSMRISRAAMAAAAIALGMSNAHAATHGSASGTLYVSATVSSSCAVGSSSLNFNDATGVTVIDQTATGAITVNCANGVAYNVDFSGDLGPYRTLKGASNSSNKLYYNLYQDSGHTTLWGTDLTGIGNASPVLTGTGATQSIPVYGLMPKSLNTTPPAVDSYSEAVTILVTY